MSTNEIDDTVTELLRAAERSLFDATIRLEEAFAAMDGRRTADAQIVLAQARRWAELISAGLERMSPEELRAAQASARRAVASAGIRDASNSSSNANTNPARLRGTYVPWGTRAKA